MRLTTLAESNIHFEEAALVCERILYQVKQVIVGQENLIEKLTLSLIIGGHCLIEGAPGLAKTLLMKTISATIKADFKRIQFTNDLLPADLLGFQTYNSFEHSFSFNRGPIFGNLILVDEINRAPAKVQSALLEAMQEKQVTINGTTYPLEEVFLVLATQNPYEHEGTYALPDAQIDRFTFKLLANYPSAEEETSIINRFCLSPNLVKIKPVCTIENLLRIRRLTEQVFIEPEIVQRIVQIAQATRQPEQFGLSELKDKIEYGISPRASIALAQAIKGLAVLRGRNYARIQDLHEIVLDVFRHRLVVSYKAAIEGIKPEDIINIILKKVS